MNEMIGKLLDTYEKVSSEVVILLGPVFFEQKLNLSPVALLV